LRTRDTDALVPAEAAKALGLLGGGARGERAGSALGGKDVAVRREAAGRRADGPRAEPGPGALVEALSDKDKICAQAARASGDSGPRPPRGARLTTLSDPDVLSRARPRGARGIGREQP
jgi:hypothetical protein